MIRNIAELLQGFINEETKKLDAYKLKHAPTIGDMYEGLSAELLSRAIPPHLNLKIVEGFITDGADYLSGQMDCMLVRGTGEKIPYTKSYKWHVKNVIAVFEVKKNLYSKDLIDSFHKLRQVSESYSKYLFDGKHKDNKKLNLAPSYKTFSQLTGITAPNYNERETLTKENELIYTTLIMEQLTPITIVLGYNGFSTEFGLREGLAKFIEKQGIGQGYGVPSFPQLIIGGEFSLVKGNGNPYITSMRDGYWDFMFSSKARPILLMLEFIWTKLSLEYEMGMPWGDDLEQENLNEFLRAKPVMSGDQRGWILKYDELSNKTLNSRPAAISWKPTEISSSQYIIFNQLARHDIKTTEPSFIEFVKKTAESKEDFIKSMLATGYVSIDGENLSLISDSLVTAIMPNGKILVAENNLETFEKWLQTDLYKHKS